jgi:prepilin-type N-terminal cleavage/methylation domain-containing protein
MNKKGVTLIELIVVMVIITICATLTVPSISSWMRNYRLRSATRDLVSILQTAKMRASIYNFEYRVNFSGDLKAFQLVRGSAPSGSATWTPEGPNYLLPNGVNLQINGTMDNFIQFNTNSTCDKSATLRLINPNYYYDITLSPTTGKTTVARGSCGS